MLEKFEWFYSSTNDKWGLRRLNDGNVQIAPSFDWIRIDRINGLDITFVTSAKTDEEAYALLKAMGMPFVRRGEEAVV